MTATLREQTTGTHFGRKLRDCDDGEILTVLGIDAEAHYIVVGEDGRDWRVPADECHEVHEAHQPLRFYGSDGWLPACFAWVHAPVAGGEG